MSWLEQQVRQTKLLQILLCFVVIAAVGAALFLNQRYFENLRAGPYTIPVTELSAAQSADDLARYWVNIMPTRLLDTGVDHVSVRKRYGVETGRSVTGHYWVAAVGDRLLFIETSGAMQVLPNQMITGKLVDTPQNVGDHLTRGINPATKAKVLPMMLKTDDFAMPAYVGLSGAALATTGALIWALIAGFRALAPRGHRALRALEAASVSLDEAGRSIEEDLRARAILKIGSYTLTRGYMVRTGLGFDVRALQDLLWAYPIVVSHKLYGFIPTGKSHKLALFFPNKKLTLKVGRGVGERAMDALPRVAPWTILGHSLDLERAWARQRPQFVAHVAERRAQVLAQQAGAAPSAQSA